MNFDAAIERIKSLLSGRTVRFMEVCGTHTVAISRAGLRPMLAPEVELISGPGCPVCVTPAQDIAKILWLAQSNFTVATFGDMMKVPAGADSLAGARANGADVRILYSPLESVEFASENPDKNVVFVGVGFETTAPAIAGAIFEAARRKLQNFAVLTSLKTIPIPLEIICKSPQICAQGFILPGHVSAVIGSDVYQFIPQKFDIPGVVAGFEPEDILDSVFLLTEMLLDNKPDIRVSYKRVVRAEGNIAAKALMEQVFEPCDAVWRGIGLLPGSGLRIRPEYAQFDAQSRFHVPDFPDAADNPACRCAQVILGLIRPTECALFDTECNPQHPQGPCMISSEGACAAYYKYGE